jgi:hypothetical protein
MIILRSGLELDGGYCIVKNVQELDDDIGLDEDLMKEILLDEERRKIEVEQKIEQEAKAAAAALEVYTYV